MIIEKVFEKMQKQYKEMHTWMQGISVQISVVHGNNNTLSTNYQKMLKRIARIEEKLNIINIEKKE